MGILYTVLVVLAVLAVVGSIRDASRTRDRMETAARLESLGRKSDKRRRAAEREYQAEYWRQYRMDDMWYVAALHAQQAGRQYTLLHPDGPIVINEWRDDV